MRLSTKGWNNVLIFGILLIIFVFNFRHQLHLSPALSRTVISSALTIVEIETPDYSITRIGRKWETTPPTGISSEKLQEIVNNWQKTPLDHSTEQNKLNSDFIIKLFVAEQTSPIIVQLHQQQNDQYILQIDDQLFLSLPPEKLPLFLGI